MSDDRKDQQPSALKDHVPENPYDVPISGHDYDGIIELDNQLPNWWLFIFLGTLIFGGIYWLHDVSGSGSTNRQRLEQRLAKIEQKKSQEASDTPEMSDEEILALAEVETAMARAGQHYQSKCASCHGARGEGGIGPSFRNDEWIHGSEVATIQRVLNQGVLEKGMPPWKDVLRQEEINELVAYVRNFTKMVP